MTTKNKDEEGLGAQQYIGSNEPGLTESVEKLFGGRESLDDPEAPESRSKEPELKSDTHSEENLSTPQIESSGDSEEPVEEEEKTEAKESPKEEEIDIEAEGQFGSGDFEDKDDVKEEGFDESAFDSETARILKSLEEKGHPGDVYKDLRQKLKDAQKELQSKVVPEDTQKELEELRSKAAQAEALQERLDEVSWVSAKVRVESGDDYRKEVLAPAQEILLATKDLAESYGVEQDNLNQLISEKDRKVRNQLIETYLQDFSEMDRQEIYGMIRRYAEIETKRNQMLENAESELASRKATQEAEVLKQQEERKKQFRTIQDSIWGKYSEKIPGALDASGNPTQEFASLKKKSLLINPEAYDARDEAYTAFTGTVFPSLVKKLIQQDRKIKALEAAEESAERGSPKATPDTGKTAAPKKAKEGEGLLGRINSTFR